MKIAVIGSGFAGLGAAWHLAKAGHEVCLYDQKGVGAGASGIATGLLHPYVGEMARRSQYATEGMAATKELIAHVEKRLNQTISQAGIVRIAQNLEQEKQLLAHAERYGDVEPLGNGKFFMREGLTVDCPLYLQGLLEEIGVPCLQEEPEGYDLLVIAAGAGSLGLVRGLRMGMTKGQVLTCRGFQEKTSWIGKGYIAKGADEGICYVGSTYERGDLSETPNLEDTQKQLFAQAASFFPATENLQVMDCRAGFRVTRHGHYLPILQKVGETCYLVTGLGSRGLLYHALLGKLLAATLSGAEIPPEFAFNQPLERL
ncbi:MAG: FAD-binding oxidoreductase [Verrucomicrobia bacterium]|nr:FAD-binding oxidoreductase [Verrucomicrobiota bacterium]